VKDGAVGDHVLNILNLILFIFIKFVTILKNEQEIYFFMKFELDKTYELVLPTGRRVIATLIKIESYPSAGFPDDYVFKYVSGDRSLINAKSTTLINLLKIVDNSRKIVKNELQNDLFFLPNKLVSMLLSIKEVKSDEYESKM
jgi:hypothetical protein